MKGRQGFADGYIAALFWIVLIIAAAAQAQDDPNTDLERVLAGVRVAQDRLSFVRMEIRAQTYTHENGQWAARPCQLLIQQYLRSGQMMKVEAERFVPDESGGFRPDGFQEKHVWDGERSLLIYGNLPQGIGCISKDPQQGRAILSNLNHGNILEALFPQGNCCDIFERYRSHVRLRSSKETVNGSDCDVLEAQTPMGDYIVWIDSHHGFCIRQAQYTIDKDDLYMGKPLKQSSVSLSCLDAEKKKYYCWIKGELRDIAVKKIDGAFISVSGTYVKETLFSDQSQPCTKYVFERQNIVCRPDPDKYGGFKIDIPEGLHIEDVDSPPKSYKWTGGQLTPINGQ